MISNVPTPESLNDVALRLYFSAWSDLIHVVADFEMTFEPGDDPHAPGVQGWDTEWAEYIVACQPELQSICALIQQSNELALKAKICEVSPFLLLLKNDAKLSAVQRNLDFSTFRTLDALDLPGAVNTFCKHPLSEKFIETYNRIRSLRNKIAHLGQPGTVFEPSEFFRILIFQYIELWKGRMWLSDRLLFASKTRAAFFHDGRYSSPEMVVMNELPYTLKILTNVEFTQLFGHSKSTRRYVCHVCFSNATTKYEDPDLQWCKTAFLDRGKPILKCVMCGESFKIARRKCALAGCQGSIVGDNADDYVGFCHSCGKHQGD